MIIIVTGQPRTGTSLTMMILNSGGISAEYDPTLNANINPYGSFESRKIITNKEQIEGKCIKCLVPQTLFDYPEAEYKVIMPVRPADQIILSRLEAFKGKQIPKNLDGQKEQIEKHYKFIRFIVNNRPDMELLEVSYDDYFLNTDETLDAISNFIGGKFNSIKAKKAIDPRQYKIRNLEEVKTKLETKSYKQI